MSSQTTLGLAAAALVALAAPASAQALPDWSNGWSGQATIYAWLPAINGAQEGPDGEPLVDLDQANVLRAPRHGLHGRRRDPQGPFGLLLDVVYADLSTDGDLGAGAASTPRPAPASACTPSPPPTASTTSTARFVDLYGGARFFDTKLTFSLDTANLGGFDREANLDWTDPIVGIRGATPLTERWSVSGFADVGGFDGPRRPELGNLRRHELRLQRRLGRHHRLPLHVDPLPGHRPRPPRHRHPGPGPRRHLQVLTPMPAAPPPAPIAWTSDDPHLSGALRPDRKPRSTPPTWPSSRAASRPSSAAPTCATARTRASSRSPTPTRSRATA